MAAHAVTIHLHQMDALLAAEGFRTISLPGTAEVVYAKAYRRVLTDGTVLPISLRVYTSIVGAASRDTGEDAIRVSAWTKLQTDRPRQETVRMLGGSKRVHRVENWRANLMKRLETWEEMIQPYCPECGAPMFLKQPKSGQTWKPFYGCCRYPDCKGTRLCDKL